MDMTRTEEVFALLNQRGDMTSADCEEPFAGSAFESQPLKRVSEQGQPRNSAVRPNSAGSKQPAHSSKQDRDLRIVLGDPELSAQKGRKLRRSTNSFRKKLFGQDRDENAEEIITQQTSNNVWIHPLSKFRDGWDTTTLSETHLMSRQVSWSHPAESTHREPGPQLSLCGCCSLGGLHRPGPTFPRGIFL